MVQQCCSHHTSPNCRSLCRIVSPPWVGAVSRAKKPVVAALLWPPCPGRDLGPLGRGMWRDALLVAGKDLRIEARSRVALWQVLPFALLVLILCAFALGPGTSALRSAAPGLFWLAVLFSTVLTTQRSFAI